MHSQLPPCRWPASPDGQDLTPPATFGDS